MLYLIANKTTAAEHGFPAKNHVVNGNLVLLNEREVVFSPTLSGTLEQRAAQLSASIYTEPELQIIINEGGWNNA